MTPAAFRVQQREEVVEGFRFGSGDLVHHRLVRPNLIGGVNVDPDGFPAA
jgi:hypothetical protein